MGKAGPWEMSFASAGSDAPNFMPRLAAISVWEQASYYPGVIAAQAIFRERIFLSRPWLPRSLGC